MNFIKNNCNNGKLCVIINGLNKPFHLDFFNWKIKLYNWHLEKKNLLILFCFVFL